MTAAYPEPKSVPLLQPSSVLLGRPGAAVSCFWCRRLLEVSQGKLSLEEAADQLHMPVGVCLKLARKALERGWGDLNTFPSEEVQDAEREVMQELLWLELQTRVRQVAGTDGEQVLHKALACVGTEQVAEPALAPAEFPSLMLALEVLIGEERRDALRSHFDALKTKYGLLSLQPN